MTNCTWKECTEPAKHSQVGKDGKQWANLCQMHHEKLEDAIKSMDVKRIMGSWVKAQGGAEACAKSTFGFN